jgi:hypothetical protein
MQGWEVVIQDLNKFGRVPGCVQDGHARGVDWCKFVNLIGVMAWNPMGCVMDRADEGD